MKNSGFGRLVAFPAILAAVFSLLLFSGCGSDSSSERLRTFTMTIAHINDSHSHLEPFESALVIDDTATKVEMGGFPRLKTAVDMVSSQEPNVILLHAGDAVQGTLYFTKFLGDAEFEFLNMIDVDAMCPGNHEFDKGPALLASLTGKADFPLVAANIDTTGSIALSGRISPYVILRVGKERIAVVGLTTPDIPLISSPGKELLFEDPADSLERTVMAITSAGINKIIVLSHLGLDEDRLIAERVRGVDVIVGGHSHSLLGAAFEQLGMSPSGEYPTVVYGPDRNRVLIVHAWQWGGVLGLLEVTFTAEGAVSAWSGRPTLVLGDSFMQRDGSGTYAEVPRESEAYRNIVRKLELSGVAAVYPPDPAAREKIAFYSKAINELMNIVVAVAGDDLIRGGNSGPGPVVADSMMWRTSSLQTQVALQNAGGVRKDLLAGDISVGDVYEILPFDNTLVVIDLSGAELRMALEEGVDFMLKRGKSPPYLYVSGMRFRIDTALQAGMRVSDIAVRNQYGEYVDLSEGQRYRVVTNSFMAGGGDGYETLREEEGFRIDTGFIDADVLREYMELLGTIVDPAEIRIDYH